MKVTDVYLCGLGVFQPPTVDAGQAARRGEYDAGAYLENRLTGVCVAGDISPPEMAVHAARQALSRAAASPAAIGMVVHATAFLQGPEGWHPPSYIQKEIAGNDSPAFEIRLGCTGAFAGMEFAALRLGTMGPVETVLLTTAENYGWPHVDRWNGMSGFVHGDAAAALLLCRGHGFARLRSVGSVAVPELEPLGRGGEPLAPSSVQLGKQVDMSSRAQYFRDNVMSLNDATEVLARAQAKVIERTLDESGRTLDDMTRVVYVNAAGYILQQLLLGPLGIPMERTTWQFGRGVGHSGANDQLLSLNHLLVTGQIAAGDHVLLAGGGGATVSAAVLEILDIPAWARA